MIRTESSSKPAGRFAGVARAGVALGCGFKRDGAALTAADEKSKQMRKTSTREVRTRILFLISEV
jgi:hypothetical protein